jgi:hydroxymethylbilane synthase
LARIGHCLLPPEWYAAVGQGALGIECRSNDAHCLNLLEPLADAGAMAGATAERALLARLRAGCHAPVGAHTWLDQQDLCLEAVVLSRDGQTRICDRGRGPVNDAVALGQEVAQRLLARGAAALIEGG